MFLVRVALGIEETSDLLRRSLDELLLLLHDLGDTRETIDLGIHIIDDLLLEILLPILEILRIMGLYNVEEKEAVKMMADTDKRRMTNYSFYTEQKWGKASNYTLCLNSSQLGYDRCEKIILDCM